MTMGFRAFERSWRPVPDLVERFRDLPVANISDVMGRLNAGGDRLRPHHDRTYLCGQALTVKTRPGDNLMVHHALDIVRAGEVIVVAADGDITNAIVGEFMVSHAMRAGAAGMVIDGAIRDVGAIRAGSFPVYAAGVTHRGPYKDGPGELNVAVSVGGMVVNPGDIIVGDEDGLLAIALADAEEVLQAALLKQKAEQQQWERIRAGTNDRRWVGEALRKGGCTFIPHSKS